MFLWTKEEIEKILLQLNDMGLPFEKHPFRKDADKAGLVLLGRGSTSYVFEACGGTGEKRPYAIKIIGFGEQYVGEERFWQAVQGQEELCIGQEHVVSIYDAVSINMWLDEDAKIVKTKTRRLFGRKIGGEWREEETFRADWQDGEDGDCRREKINRHGVDAGGSPNVMVIRDDRVYLQFILMEKAEPILQRRADRKPKLSPDALAAFEEAEIRKVAYDVGTALAVAHDQKILHRDIKPENIFYSPKEGLYKLGDFGIALKTADGMADTVAYTDGYGAPEVIYRSDEKYDVTADIYSLGMTLYVLLNHLKFPKSDDYHTNRKEQYKEGFILPEPESGSGEFIRIVEKMCRYDPDERYQSMDEVLLELDALENGPFVKYQKEHKKTITFLAVVFLIAGMAMWKLSFLQGLKFVLSPGSYVFLVLCVLKFMLARPGKTPYPLKLLTFVLGIILCFTTGFAWWKPLLVLLLSAEDNLGAFWGIGVLTANFTYLIAGKDDLIIRGMQEYRWLPVTLLPIAFVLFFQLNAITSQERTGRQDRRLTDMFLLRDLSWVLAALYFLQLLLWGWILTAQMTETGRFMLETVSGTKWIPAIQSIQPLKAGTAGLLVSLFWMIRQRVMTRGKKAASPHFSKLIRNL